MTNTKPLKLLAATMLFGAMMSAQAITTSQQDRAELDRYIADVADMCKLDISASGVKKSVANSPALFWYMSYVTMNGELSNFQKEAIKPAFKCQSGPSISVDEAAAKSALNSVKPRF